MRREPCLPRMGLAALLVVSIGAPLAARAQQPPPTSGPYFHRVMSATSADGLTWTKDGRVLLEHASVPCAIVTPAGRMRIYYVDASQTPETANVAESADGGQTFVPLGLTIANRTASKAVDPGIVLLSDGRYRLYFYGSAPGDPGGTDTHTIYSAISTDGVAFTEEAAVFAYPGLVDPDVFRARNRCWYMFVFSLTDRTTVFAQSRSGTKFRYRKPLGLDGWGTTAPVKLDDGRFRMYAFDQHGQTTVGASCRRTV